MRLQLEFLREVSWFNPASNEPKVEKCFEIWSGDSEVTSNSDSEGDSNGSETGEPQFDKDTALSLRFELSCD
jgi:hypothetical protein